MDSESKQRISLYLDKNLIRNADVAMKKYGYRSRNEFYTKAVESFIADILLEDNKTLLSEKLAQAIADSSKDNATIIAKGLFRYAVQLEMVMRMLADQFDYKPSDVGLIRQEAINNVRRTRGKVSLEDIITGYYNE